MNLLDIIILLNKLGFLYSYIHLSFGVYKINENEFLYVKNNDDILILNQNDILKLDNISIKNINEEIYRVNYNSLKILIEEFKSITKEKQKIYNDLSFNFDKEINIINYILENYKDKEHYDTKSLNSFVQSLNFVSDDMKKWFKNSIFQLN